MKNIDDKFVLYAITYGLEYFNGLDEDGWIDNADKLSNLKHEFIFDTLEDAKAWQEDEGELKEYYTACRVKDIPLKHVNPYASPNKPKFRIEKGHNNEVCMKCGVNIIAGEKYLCYHRTDYMCLHCAMNLLDKNINQYDEVPEAYKKAWKEKGKKTARELCSDVISKDEDG